MSLDDVLAHLRAAGFAVEGAIGLDSPAWLIDYDSSRCDRRTFLCIPLEALDARIKDALMLVDGLNVCGHSNPRIRAAGMLLACAFGAADPDDIEVENFELPEAWRLGADDVTEHYETLFSFGLLDVQRLGVVRAEKLSTRVERLVQITDRRAPLVPPETPSVERTP
jgi:hypothetical protein